VELIDASNANPTGADPLASLPPPTLASIAVTILPTDAAADSTNPVATDSETAPASELVGRYTGQISARIERGMDQASHAHRRRLICLLGTYSPGLSR